MKTLTMIAHEGMEDDLYEALPTTGEWVPFFGPKYQGEPLLGWTEMWRVDNGSGPRVTVPDVSRTVLVNYV